MNTPAQSDGRCLCGAVRFVAARVNEVGMCHCGICRRWTGGSPLAGGIAETVTVTAGESLRWYAASAWGERGFCRRCGASLFWRQKGAATHWVVSAGALPDDAETQLAQHIYIDDKPAYYDLRDNVPRLTGGEFTASVVAKMPPGKRLLVKAFIALQHAKNRIKAPRHSGARADGGERGHCLCGAVRFRLQQAVAEASMCHCGQCRRWGGGAGLPIIETAATVESGDTLRWHQTSAHSERGFCERCGASLFWRATDDGGITEVCVGALETDTHITLAKHIYIDDKPAFYEMADNARRLTGAQSESEDGGA